jgi:uncharacterized protein (UPF0335 family)
MRIARTLGLGLGLVLLVGVGAATLSRGQSPTQVVEIQPLAVEDLARLEAEVEALQVEHDVARADLQDFLKKFNRLELLRRTVSLTPTALFHEFANDFLDKGSDDLSQACATMNALAGKMQLTQIQSDLSREMEKVFLSLHRVRDQRLKDFIDKTEELNKKKRALSEARPKTEREAR